MKNKLIAVATLLLLPLLLGIAPGEKAPDFSAKNQNGKTVKLSDFKGKPVLLYFYPKDETPGCTKEACNFRDQHDKITKLGGVVLGVSRQDEKSHKAFAQNHKLPFDLLVDDGSISKAYGVGTYMGMNILKRESVLIAPTWVISHIDGVGHELTLWHLFKIA